MIEITSFSNKKIKDLIKLKKRNIRDERDVFFVEGYKEILFACSSFEIVDLFFCEKLFLKDNEFSLIEKISKKGANIFKCKKNIFEKVSYRDRPDGLIATVRKKDRSIEELEKKIKDKKDIVLMVCSGIEKPGNLGSILRTCECVGVDAVVVTDKVTDIYNPNVIRSSRGAFFNSFVVEIEANKLLEFLRKKSIKIAATTPHSDDIYTEKDLTGSIAFLVGAEQYGLNDFWLLNSDMRLKIPMKGKSDSLNVAVSAATVLYESLRQKGV